MLWQTPIAPNYNFRKMVKIMGSCFEWIFAIFQVAFTNQQNHKKLQVLCQTKNIIMIS